MRGPRASSAPQRLPAVPAGPVRSLATPAGPAGAGAQSEVMVRPVAMTHRPGVVYPGNAGEPAYPLAPAGAASDTVIQKPLGDDAHELKRRELAGKRPRWRRPRRG